MIDRYFLTFLLNALWQIPLAALIAFGGCWLLRNGPSRHRHVLWVAALAASVVLPAASAWKWHADPTTVSIPAVPIAVPGSQPREGSPAVPAPAPTRTVPVGRTAAEFLAAGYLLFLIYRAARLCRAGLFTFRIHQGASAVPDGTPAAGVWERCASVFRLSGVELRSSPRISSTWQAAHA